MSLRPPQLALLIGLLLTIQGILGIAAPEAFVSTLRFVQTPPMIYLAAVLRVAFGIVFILAAAESRAPRFLRDFGFIIVIGGLLTPFLGLRIAQVIFAWWAEGGPALVRLCAGVPLALGLLVIYAVAQDRSRNETANGRQ